MKALFIAAVAALSVSAFAEEKTCTVKGMHCQGCVDMVKEKVCSGDYATCDVSVADEKKKIGKITLTTKAADGKVDEAALGKAIESTGYKLEKCEGAKAKAKKG